jgi:hypothetical protein
MKMTCPHCGVIGSAHDSLPGAKVRCPQCDKVFKVMEEEITCPHCAVTGSAFGSPVGTKLRCPQCEKVFLLTQELLTGPLVSDGIAVEMAEVVPVETSIVAEPAALPEVEPVSISEGMANSKLESAAATDERPSVPEIVAEVAAEAVSPRHFASIQASPMAMESSVEAVIELPEEVATGVEIVPELQMEVEIPPELEPAAELELEASPELESDLELEPVLEQIPEAKAEKMVEPVVEVLPEPVMETIAEVVAEMIPEPVLVSLPEEIVEPLPEPELVSDLTPEAEAVSSVAEEAAPGETKEQEVVVEEDVEKEPAPSLLPLEICKGCGESFHPQLLQEINGTRYCGVCQLRMAATTEKTPRVGGGRVRGVLAAIILLGLLALIALLLMKFGIF